MTIPVRTKLFWWVFPLFAGPSVFQQPEEKVRRASDRLRGLVNLPGAWIVVGHRDRNVTVEQTTVSVNDGVTLPVRIYRPKASSEQVRPVVVNFHGGGFISGDAKQSEWWCSSVAAKVGAVVVSVDYRLAPEHRFPVAAEDCFGATAWVAEHAASLRIDPSRLAVMGDSAGGNLSAVVCLMARDRGGPAISMQILLYPAVELVDHFPSEDENEFSPILCKADLVTTGLYCSDEDALNPYASPLRAQSHENLPPALIQTAQHDPLRDQGTAYAEALRSAGVPVRITNYAEAVHGYISVPGVVPDAQRALTEVAEELIGVFR